MEADTGPSVFSLRVLTCSVNYRESEGEKQERVCVCVCVFSNMCVLTCLRVCVSECEQQMHICL